MRYRSIGMWCWKTSISTQDREWTTGQKESLTLLPATPSDVRKVSDLPKSGGMDLGYALELRMSGAQPQVIDSARRKVGDLPHIRRHSRGRPPTYGNSWRTTNAKTTLELLANLQHEFWVYGHPVWVGLAARQHERHLYLPRREA